MSRPNSVVAPRALAGACALATSTRLARNPLLDDPFFRRFFDLPEQRRDPVPRRSAGSGVIVDAERGYVPTNHHVIENADEVTVTLADRRRFDAELIGSDAGTDIALLRIQAENLTALALGDSDALDVGDFVVAIETKCQAASRSARFDSHP